MGWREKTEWNNPQLISDEGLLKPWIVHITLSVITILAIISSVGPGIVNSLIAGELCLSASQDVWLSTAFLMMLGVFLPITGRLSLLIGCKRTCFLGIIVFVLSSLVLAFSVNFWSFLVARIIEGAGAALIFPICLSLLQVVFPKRLVPLAVSLYITIGFGVGVWIACILGGYIGEYLSWRLLFWINVIIGTPALLVVWLFFKETELQKNLPPFDLLGFFFFILTLSSGLALINSVKSPWNTAAWQSRFIIGCLITIFFGTIFFLLIQLRSAHPLFALKYFTIRPFLVGCATLSVVGALFFGTLLLTPNYLEGILQYDKLTTGVMISWIGVGVAVAGFAGSLLTRYIDVRLLALLGLSLLAASCFLNMTITIQTENHVIISIFVLRSIGIGLSLGPMTSFSLMELPKEALAFGAVMATFFRQMGAAFGSSILNIISVIREAFHSLLYGSQIDTSSAAFRAQSRFIKEQVQGYLGNSPQELNFHAQSWIKQYTAAQAKIIGINDAYFCAGLLLILCALALIGVMVDSYVKKKRAQNLSRA